MRTVIKPLQRRVAIAMTDSLPTEGDGVLPTDALSTVDPGTRTHYFGNQRDDDGLALDSYLQAAPDAPLPDTYLSYPEKPALPQKTRVLTRSIDMTNYAVGDSLLLFPADENRQHLHLEANGKPIDIYIPSTPTTNNTVLWAGPTPSRSAGLSITFDIKSVDTAGNMILQGSLTGLPGSWTWLTNKSLTSASTTMVNIASPLPPFLQIVVGNGATGAGTVGGLLSIDGAAEGFGWGSERPSVVSPDVFFNNVETDMHTGPVYVSKTQEGPLVISGWVVTV